MASQIYMSCLHTDQEAQTKLGDLTLKQAFYVEQTGYLNITQIGNDEAAPVDTLDIFCNTIVGSASNRRTWTHYGGITIEYLAATAYFQIDGRTVTHTATGGVLDINLTTGTNTGISGINIDMITHDLGNTQWAYGFYGTYNTSACTTATSNAAVIYLAAPTADPQCNDYGMYVEAGYDWGIAVAGPVEFASLVLAPSADPTPYPLDFQLEGWGLAGTGTAGVYTQGRVINMEYGAARTLDGALYGMYIDFDTSVTHGSQQITIIHTLIDATDFDYDAGNTASLINATMNNTIGPEVRIATNHTQDSGIDYLMGGAIVVAANQTWRGLRIADNGNALTVGVGETGYGLLIDFDTLVTPVGGTWAALRIETPAGTDALSIGDGSINWIPGTADTFIIAPSVTNLTLFDFQLETEFTRGTLFNADYGGATTLAGALYGIIFDFSTNVTPADQIILGIALTMPANVDADSAALNILTTQDYGRAINIVSTATIAAAQDYTGIRINGDGATLNHANAIYYGMNIDHSAITLTAFSQCRAVMLSLAAQGEAIYIDNAIVDSIEKNLIYADIDCAAITAAAYFRGSYFNIDETVIGNNGSFIVGYQADITGFATGRADLIGSKLAFDGTKSGGDITRGYYVDSDMTINHASEIFYGMEIDLDGMTVGAATAATFYGIYVNADGITYTGVPTNFAGVRIEVAAGYQALSIGDGSINWVPGTGDSFVIAPSVTGLTLFDFQLETEFTTGYLIWADFGAATTLTGPLTGMFLGFSANVSGADQTVEGYRCDMTSNVGVSSFCFGGASYQDQGAFFFAGLLGTVAAAQTLRGLEIDADVVTLNHANAIYYGAHIDQSGMTLTSYQIEYGIFIEMPATYGAGVDAALYATGDGNIAGILVDGVGASILCDRTNANNAEYGIDISKDVTLTAAAAANYSATNNALRVLENLSDANDDVLGYNITANNNIAVISLSHLMNTSQATTDTIGATLLNIPIASTTVAVTDTVNWTTRAVDIVYTLTQTAGVINLNATDLFRIDFNVSAGVAICNAGAGNINMILLDGDGFIPGVTVVNATNISGIMIDWSSASVNDAQASLFGINIIMPTADHDTAATVEGERITIDTAVNVDNAMIGLLISKDASIDASAAANVTVSNYVAQLATEVTNADDGGFDAIVTSNVLNIDYSLVNTATVAPTADQFTGTAFDIDISASVQNNANSIISTMTARAVDISYALTHGAAGTLNLDATDIFRIDFDIAAGVAICNAGAGNLNIMFLDGDGFVPGATFVNNTNVHGLLVDLSAANLGADAQATSFVGVRVDLPANYGANGAGGGGLQGGNSNAAFYATGNGNIFSALAGDGLRIDMTEASSVAVNLFTDVTDLDNAMIGLQLSKDATAVGGVRAVTNPFINMTSVLVSNGANLSWNNGFIAATLTLTETANVLSYSGTLLNFTVAAAATSPLLSGGGIGLAYTGTGLIDANYTGYNFSMAYNHDGGAADTLRAMALSWAGNLPATSANLDMIYISYSGTLGSGGADGGNLAGLNINMDTATINSTTGVVYGALIDLSAITLTNVATFAGLRIDVPASRDLISLGGNGIRISGLGICIGSGTPEWPDATVPGTADAGSMYVTDDLEVDGDISYAGSLTNQDGAGLDIHTEMAKRKKNVGNSMAAMYSKICELERKLSKFEELYGPLSD